MTENLNKQDSPAVTPTAPSAASVTQPAATAGQAPHASENTGAEQAAKPSGTRRGGGRRRTPAKPPVAGETATAVHENAPATPPSAATAGGAATAPTTTAPAPNANAPKTGGNAPQSRPSGSAPRPRGRRPQTQSQAVAQAVDANAIKTKVPTVNAPAKTAKTGKIAIIPLGGLGEVGKNMTAIRYGNNIIVVDCGMSFPDDELLGIDLVIPDISYLLEQRSQVRGIFITHGHEDHIGALPYVLRDLNVPVYGGQLAMGLLKNKLKEHALKNVSLNEVHDKEVISCGPFKVEFIRVSHSIPDSFAIAIHTPIGTILHTGDFKVDLSPVDDQPIDLRRLAALGEEGVLAMMADSTNVEKPGYTPSEKTVGPVLESLFYSARGRVILTTFASNVHRVQQAIWAAEKCNRKVAFVGRGMLNVSTIARELNFLKVKKGTVVEIDELNRMPDHKAVVIATGSQGETLSGLTLMSQGEHRQVQLRPTDRIIISAYPIPGNEKLIGKVIDNLYRHGVEVIYGRGSNIHVSGHASSEELKLMLNMIKPKFFIPAHGEYRMLHQHACIAEGLGISPANIFIMENGNVLELDRRSGSITGKVASGRVLIDGRGVGDVGTTVLKDRKQLSNDGIVIIVMTFDRQKNVVVGQPEITTRGFVFEKDNEHILEETRTKVLQTWNRFSDTAYDESAIKGSIRGNLGKFLYDKTGRRPIILPVIVEVNQA